MKKIALIQPGVLRPWESGEINRISSLVCGECNHNNFILVNNVDEAEIIVLLETNSLKHHRHISEYERIIDSGYRDGRILLVVNYEDGPSGVLPGLYSSLEKFKYDSSLHLSWPHLRLPNELVEKQKKGAADEDTFLFSFSGSCSHPIRRKLFDTYSARSSEYRVREINKWYNHDANDKVSYVDEISRSLFVLCPRGIASYSHRILETIALGRVPVIIADNWVPFSIEADEYYIQIQESDIGKIDKILNTYLSSYETLQKSVGSVYSTYFSPERRYSVALNHLVSLSSMIPNNFDPDFLKRRLNSKEFWQMNGWLLKQRIARRVNTELTRCLRRNIKILSE